MTPADGAVAHENYVAEDDGGAHPVGRRHLPVIATRAPRPKRDPDVARKATVNVRRYPKRVLDADALLYPEQPGVDYHRPTSPSQCARAGLGTTTPCPFVSCGHHLYLDVEARNGNLRVAYPGHEVADIPQTCGLVVADGGGATYEAIGAVLNLTRERVRQLEKQALRKLRATHPELVALLMAETPAPSGDLRARVVGIRHSPDVMPRGGR